LPAPRAGTKTIGVNISGTATVKAVCTVGEGWQAASGYVPNSTGLTATGLLTFTDLCDQVQLETTSGSDCAVSGWLKQDPTR
jgi:hypothetical protein